MIYESSDNFYRLRCCMLSEIRHRFLLLFLSAMLFVSYPLLAQNYYGSDDLVIVGGDYDYPPFEFINNDYIPEGFNVDIIRAVAKTMQLNIEIDLEPWAQIRDKFENNEVHMLQGMYYSEKRAEKYLFSTPHIIMNQAVFRRKNSPSYTSIESLKGREVIVQKGDIMHEYVLKNNLTDKLILAESPGDGLRMLAAGKHDFLLSSRITGLYWIKELNLNNLTTGDNLVSYKYCFAVNKNNPELLAKLNEGLFIIQQTGVYNEIYEKWFSRLEPDLYILKKTYKFILIFLFGILTLLLVFILWSGSLKKTVRARTAELEKEIEEHQRAQLELNESRELYSTLFTDFTDAFILYDIEKGEIIQFNKKACELYGISREEFSKIKVTDILDFANRKRVENHLEQVFLKGFDTYDADFVNRKGEKKFLIIKSKKMNINSRELVQSIAIDITEKKKLEEKLIQAGKLEAVGTLAGGIAHDFNNILAAIIGYSEIGRISIGEGNAGWDEINEILKAGNRAKDIVRQILLFSRKDNLKKEVIDPGEVLDESWKFLSSAIPSTVRIIKNKAPELSGIFASTTQIYQILLNLCTNASQAMEDTGGTISVNLENTLRFNKKYVLLSVSDTGKGLDPDTVDRIFDPYFTTKDIGKGSGLGLAVVHGIVKESGGFIEVDNHPGEGVTFNIFFPSAKAAAREQEISIPDNLDGIETVLVIDDEESVADVISRYLATEKYNVITETNSSKALNIFTEKKDFIDLVITDQTMPEITGLELASEMKKIKNIPVLIITGYSTRVDPDDPEKYNVEKIMIKPINRVRLLKSVREILDSWKNGKKNKQEEQ